MAPAQFLCPSDGSKCLSLTGRRGKWGVGVGVAVTLQRSKASGAGQSEWSRPPPPPRPPTRSLQLCKGIWTTLTKKQNKTKTTFPGYGRVLSVCLFAFPTPSGPLLGAAVLSESAGVCLWGRSRPLSWRCRWGGARPRGGQGPRSVPRPPLVLLMYVFCAMPIKHAS